MTQSSKDSPNLSKDTTDNEVAQTWRTSTKSIGNGQCVEAARLVDGRLAMRDSKDKSGAVLLFGQNVWRVFIARVKRGDFDNA